MKTFHNVLVFSILTLNSLAIYAADNRAAAIIDNQIITVQQVIDPIQNKLYEAEKNVYELKLNQLKSMLLTRLIKAHPFSRGLTPDAFLKKYVVKLTQITPQQVDQFILAKRVPAEKINDKFKLDVKKYLEQELIQRQISQWLAVQSKEHGVVINLEKPVRPRVDIPLGDAPVLGNENAEITIVEYSDFQCPFCAKAEATVKQLQKNYAGKIKLVYKQFPLGFHKDAFRASEASFCANEQSVDYFWKLHDYMLANPKKLSVADLKSKAQQLGMKPKPFNQCLDSGKYAGKVNQDIAEGKRFGVEATPMFFVNGITVSGAQPYAVFAKLIEEELSNQ